MGAQGGHKGKTMGQGEKDAKRPGAVRRTEANKKRRAQIREDRIAARRQKRGGLTVNGPRTGRLHEPASWFMVIRLTKTQTMRVRIPETLRAKGNRP